MTRTDAVDRAARNLLAALAEGRDLSGPEMALREALEVPREEEIARLTRERDEAQAALLKADEESVALVAEERRAAGAAEAEVVRLREGLEDALAAGRVAGDLLGQMTDQRDAARADAARLREALRDGQDYAWHKVKCDHRERCCDCGYNEWMESVSRALEAKP